MKSASLILLLITLSSFVVFGAKTRGRQRLPGQKGRRKRKPNIIFILADDLDVLLGTPDVMSKTKIILRKQGIEFDNAFVTTPLCCPSRSSILTGRYVHNHNIHSNNKNCSSSAWRKGPERENFGAFLQTAGYKTGYFGKYLNDYDGSYIPPGWHSWVGLVKNSRFYNYSLNANGKEEYHGADYKKDYFTNVITNKGIKFFRREKRRNRRQPLMMVVSMAAPHGPEDAAPQYQNLFEGVRAPRTPNYNYTSKDKHWVVRVAPPLDELRGAYTDLLHRRRLLTMLSLDDAIENIFYMLKDIGELDNTYIFFSSDHGYHIGQFNLLKGKSQPYETDIRIPLYVRGPGVKGNRRIDKIALNIDLAPTFLDIAGIKRPEYMDGTSLLPLLHQKSLKRPDQGIKWRDSFLVQRGSMIVKNNTLTYLKYVQKPPRRATKKAAMLCHSANPPLPPCTPSKKRVCIKTNGMYTLKECPTVHKLTLSKANKRNCRCQPVKEEKTVTTTVLQNAVTPKSQSRQKLKKKPLSERQIYQLLMASSSSVEQLRELFKRELARIKRKYRKRSLRYLRHLRFDRSTMTKIKGKQGSRKNSTNTFFKKKIEKIDLKIVGARKRLDALRERRRKLKTKKSSEDGVGSPSISSGSVKMTCICDSPAKWKGKAKPRRKSKKQRARMAPKDMKCYYHARDHWRTPPLWTRESFSSCKNSPNNTFWCLRTINATHNFIYCEFVTSFVEYYDMKWDPYQLRNTHKTLSPMTILEFQRQLTMLRTCKGRLDCTLMNGVTLRQIKELRSKRRGKPISDQNRRHPLPPRKKIGSMRS